jgi:predicted SnoaL-like aldol condensation-catalyzing enzyme
MIQPIARPHPLEPGQTYTLYWLDIWRIEKDAIAERRDAAPKERRSMRDAST